MTGSSRRTGWPMRLVRTAIEVAVVALGFALGGTLGVGTLVYALAVGPLVHPLLPLLRVPESGIERAADRLDAAREPAEMTT